MKYKIPKGTKVQRTAGAGWEDFVTTKDAYFDQKDVYDIKDGFYIFLVPDKWFQVKLEPDKIKVVQFGFEEL